MAIKNIGKVIVIPMIFTLCAWIIFNPYCGDEISDFVVKFTDFANNSCASINLTYRFGVNDILNLCRFIEYSIFGVLLACMCKSYFQNFWKNITTPLFIGLIVSVIEFHYRVHSTCKIGAENIINSFLEVCIGIMIFAILANIKFKKKPSSRYRKGKYSGRY